TNITLDLNPPKNLAKLPVIVGGKTKKEKYGDFQKEMDLFNKAFYEVIMEGDATQRVFTFPIPTINITKDFDWDNPNYKSIWDATAKYGINYFSNFINSELDPEDIRSMCCRLRLNNKDLHHRGGGLFGSAPLTGCYDKETEILTESGWKFFKDLTKNEKVFTLAENNEIELHKPRKIFKYDYKGEMYQFKAKSLDLLVNPNHRMVIDQRYKDKRRFVEAKDLKPANHRIPKQGVWKRDEIEHFILPGIEFTKYGRQGITPYQVFREALKIEMDNWLEFFGFWLAEGCADNKNIAKRHGYRVIITQVNKKKNREIQKVLDCLPFNYYIERKINFVICNKQLWTYLRQFGNKYQKFIPKEIKNLGKRQLRILFNWMVKGDGHIRKTTGQINYWTSSEKLADDLQEVILKIGWLGTISARKRNISQIRGRKVKSGIVYTIGVQKSKHYRLRKNSIKKIYYKDKVYCCEVRNHTVFVRRNGKVSWCGNSIGVVTINLPRIGYLTKTKKEFFNKLENLMDLAKESLEIKRKTLEDFIEKDLYPYSKFYLSDIKKLRGQYWANHFSTIGLVGMNEALLNFLKKDMISDEGQKFAQEGLDFMNQRLLDYQKETKNIYNLEATPAEGTSYRLAKKDKEHYPQIITAGKDVPYYTNCVSDDTDILTKEGWKRYNDVKVRDEILTLNMDRKILEYQRILNIHTQYLDNKPMFNIKSQKQDQLITPNHMVVYDGDRKGKYSLATPRNLPWRIIIPMAGKINQYTKEIDDDIIRMIGWIITEGHFETDCNAIRITQAEWCNKNKFKEIGEILKKLKVKFKIHGDKRGRSIFRISASDGIKIRSKYISNKHIPRWCLNELDYRQLNILLETMMKGDGSISKHSKYFCSGDKQLIDEFQELCIKTCRRAVICDYREMTACYHAVPSDFHHTEINKNNIKEIKHTGIVWCPEVENHTFVARRNGKPFITGNSTQLPVDYNGDLFSALALQDNCQTKYTGGCIEKGNKVLTNKGLLNIEYIVKNFNKLKPIKVLGYNIKKGISEWDSVVDAVFVDVKKKNKIKIKAERGLDIITSDWHPFFVLERIKVNSICPVCQQKVENIKGFASHLGRNPKCREEYLLMFKYQVLEKRADELKKGDYILQNFDNLYPEKSTALNNDLMWLIGFFIGDGCISKFIDNRGGHNLEKYRVRFHSENQRALQKIVRIISEHFHTEVKVIKNDKRSKSLREVTISKKVVLDFFFKYGFNSGKKVYNISVPQKVRENFNKSNVFAFLSGLIDSDGHISKRDGDFEYQTVSDKLAEDILEISTRAGLMISKSLKASKRKNEVNIYRLRIPRYQMTRIKDKLNDSVNCSKIKTKLSDRKKRQLPVIRVTQISKVDMKDNQFYDLTTKKNHNYLAGKNTLVFIHNTVFHAFLGERIFNSESVKSLIKKVFVKFRLPYFTLTPTFSICPTHNYINGKHFTCPECGEKTEVYSRVVGYLRPIQQWNKGKQEEFKQRKVFDVENKKNLISSELQN
ncbi:MAG: hypothetical protein L6266_06120, partial [Nanoarchaeota archaeon]|nr:hypothetical protein [Nanoarchaeota archaeon]